MATQPSKPPAPGVPAVGGPPVSQPSRPAPPPLTFEQRLRRAVGAISEARTTPSSARNVIDAYPRFIGVGVSWTEFPRTLRRHGANAERVTGYATKWDVAFFHIGNAIRTYQDVAAIAKGKPPEPADMKAKRVYEEAMTAGRALLESRTQVVELIAKTPWADLEIEGTDAKGYTLQVRRPVAGVQTEGKVAGRIEGAPTPDADDAPLVGATANADADGVGEA